jgi:hypothetical protein
MSVPPYLFGAATLYLFALSSDHRRERGYHVIGGLSIALIGLIITVLGSATTVKYAGLCILLSGSYVPGPLTAVSIPPYQRDFAHVVRCWQTYSSPRRKRLRQSCWSHRWPALQAQVRSTLSTPIPRYTRLRSDSPAWIHSVPIHTESCECAKEEHTCEQNCG